MTYRGREYLRPRDEKAKNGLNNTENLDPQSGKLPHNHVPTALTIGDDSHGLTDSMNPKQQLAITIKNWAHIPDNDENLLGEGAMPALNELSSIDDGKIKKNCAGMYTNDIYALLFEALPTCLHALVCRLTLPIAIII